MSRDMPEIAAARIEAERSRARLVATARELQARLNPQTLARNAWSGTKDTVRHKSADAAEGAVDAVRKRPLAFGSAVAAIALFLAREPLMDLAENVASKVKSKGKAKRPRKRSIDEEAKTETVQ